MQFARRQLRMMVVAALVIPFLAFPPNALSEPSTSPSTEQPGTEPDKQESPQKSSQGRIYLEPDLKKRSRLQTSIVESKKPLISKRDIGDPDDPRFCAQSRFEVCEDIGILSLVTKDDSGEVVSSVQYSFRMQGLLDSQTASSPIVRFNVIWTAHVDKPGPTEVAKMHYVPELTGYAAGPMKPFDVMNIGNNGSTALTGSVKVALKNTDLTEFKMTGTATTGKTHETGSIYTFIRCDNAQEVNGGTGCVNVGFIPNLVFVPSTYPNVTETIKKGYDEHGNIGSPTEKNHLMRVDSATKKANRRAACSYARKMALIPDKPTGMNTPSCDEYPFASSYPGGNDASINWVPREENCRHGNEVQVNYRKFRIMVGDYFYVSLGTSSSADPDNGTGPGPDEIEDPYDDPSQDDPADICPVNS